MIASELDSHNLLLLVQMLFSILLVRGYSLPIIVVSDYILHWSVFYVEGEIKLFDTSFALFKSSYRTRKRGSSIITS